MYWVKVDQGHRKGHSHSQARAVGRNYGEASASHSAVPACTTGEDRIKPENKEAQSYSATSVCWAQGGTQDAAGWALGWRQVDLIRRASAPRTFHPLQGSWQLEPGLWITYLPFVPNFLSRLPWNYALALVVIFYLKQRAFPRKHVSKLNLQG